MADEDGNVEDATIQVQKLFEQLLKKTPNGFAGSSMGKFDEFRKWFASTLHLGDFRTSTYAVGSAGIAHNFSARWAQNNTISGSHVPLGLAFLGVPKDVDEEAHLGTAANTSSKFVSGEKPTSFETIVIFVLPYGKKQLRPKLILSLPNSPVAAELLKLFPGLPVRTVKWVGGRQPKRILRIPSKIDASNVQPLEGELIDELEAAWVAADYRAKPGLAARTIASLAAKRFLILAGLSGSGKSLLGMLTAKWLSSSPDQFEMIAVGADWTNKHHLLGYPDALDVSAYVTSPALKLLLRALNDPDSPYFLILDEMNLSHVERYFSDFLSAIESGQPIHLHGSDEARSGVPGTINFPHNLFVIGTVNVDETTYMFSPKVLDRANVIEFTVSRDAMKAYLSGHREFDDHSVLGGGAAFGPSLVEFSKEAAHLSILSDDESLKVSGELEKLFAILDANGLQLGFRTMREVTRYIVASSKLVDGKLVLNSALDEQICQRILPKLSGDSKRLKPILIGLASYCALASSSTHPEESAVFSKFTELRNALPDVLRNELMNARAVFPLTTDKIGRMLSHLSEHGFTTAFEA